MHEDKKKTLTMPDVKPTRSPVRTTPHLVGDEEGTSINLGAVLGLETSLVKSPIAIEKLIQAFIPPTDKKMVEKMELDEVATRLCHEFSKVGKFFLFYSTPSLLLSCS